MPGARDDGATASILFTDIRGYTRISTVLRQDVVVHLLEDWVAAMSQIITGQQGSIDKLLGDGLLARFNADEGPGIHGARAVAAAVEMQERVQDLRAEWRAAGPDIDLEIRIGIATGPVGIGDLDVDGRRESTVLGRHVNLAARLQDRAAPGGILISGPTHAALGELPPRRMRPHLEVKGFDDAYTAWEILLGEAAASRAVDPEPGEDLSAAERRRFRRQAISLELRFLLGGEWHTRSSVNVSEGGIFIATETPAPLGTEVRIQAKLPTERGTLPVALEGLVVRHNGSTEPTGMGVRFTAAEAADVETLHYFVNRVYRLADLARSRLTAPEGRARLRLRSPHSEPTLGGRPLPTSHDRLDIGDQLELERRLAHEFNRTVRYGHEFSCVVVRIDGLARMDGLERAATVLEQLCRELAASVRTTDEIFFLNECTFVVLAPETMANRVSTLLARVVEDLHGHTVREDLGMIDIRAGAFSFDGRNARDPDELLENALRACPTTPSA